jgi:class 3 adenylate cyclase
MNGIKKNLVIMFADISGSTRLFENLGDTIALEKLTFCIGSLIGIIEQYNGIVIKTIGDEIMATFENPDEALEASCSIQENMASAKHSEQSEISMHIGFHFGPVICSKDDVFGDSVNVASRMVDMAKDGQIITTRETVAELSETLQNTTRHLYSVPIKGKRDNIDLFEVIWEHMDVTYIGDSPVTNSLLKEQVLLLTYQGKTWRVDKNESLLSLGRSPANDMVVDQPCISRKHAVIEYVGGKFILSDKSSTGTYVVINDGAPIFLRRENFTLLGIGTIRFSLSRKTEISQIIRFSCIALPD